jgi:hypothetical protein
MKPAVAPMFLALLLSFGALVSGVMGVWLEEMSYFVASAGGFASAFAVILETRRARGASHNRSTAEEPPNQS